MASEFKDPSKVSIWLETALKFERQKCASNPIHRDIVDEFNYAQAWGFIVAGYFLLELSLKALLHERNCKFKKTHALYDLFERLPEEQKRILRSHYSDFLNASSISRQEIPNEIDDFFKNLDGDHSKGSFDWRYYLIEEPSGNQLPFVDINLIHEVAYFIFTVHRVYGDTDHRHERDTYSFRLHEDRMNALRFWYESQMESPTWKRGENRIEKLWGPDYNDR